MTLNQVRSTVFNLARIVDLLVEGLDDRLSGEKPLTLDEIKDLHAALVEFRSNLISVMETLNETPEP